MSEIDMRISEIERELWFLEMKDTFTHQDWEEKNSLELELKKLKLLKEAVYDKS